MTKYKRGGWGKYGIPKECRDCGTSEQPHNARGLCRSCYRRREYDGTLNEVKPTWPGVSDDEYLRAISKRGMTTANVLGTVLGVTGPAAYQRLLKLEQNGLVARCGQEKAKARPRTLWKVVSGVERHEPKRGSVRRCEEVERLRSELRDLAKYAGELTSALQAFNPWWLERGDE